MLTFFIFLFILGLLIIVHEWGHFFAARKSGVKVESFCVGFGPQLFVRKKGDTEYALSLIPLGGYVKMAGDNLEEYGGKKNEFLAQAPGRRCRIILAGPLLNYFLGFFCFWLIFFSGYPRLTARVGEVLEGYGAKEAGIMPADKILAIDGKQVQFWDELQKIIQAKSPSSKVEILLLRENRQKKVIATVKGKEITDPLGHKHHIGMLGLAPTGDFLRVRYGLFKSFFLGLEKTLDLTLMTYKGLWFLLWGKLSLRESVVGPLGVYFITSRVARLGITALLQWVAVLNVSLCIFNLLPLPVLDGGHILLLGIEKLRGKTLSLKAEQILKRLGFTFIISLAILITYNDLLRFFGDKFFRFLR